ncbi:MAG: RagB/SusD family nutrient uptake outer membrane protein [Flavobacteriaceae bacterium]|nr:MAG: RagB/SusD family nutrient uptake outer membrane protein [Flavobacteriaceae bacterium]
MKMKKLNNIFTLSLLLVLLVSCNQYLDTELVGQYTSSTFYKTKDQAIQAINATYQIASFSSTNNNIWVFGDVASDDAVKGGNDGDQSDIGFVNDFNVNTDNGTIEAIWKHYYEGISRANNVIYYVPNIEMDIDLKAQIVGQAKFLRAYYYYHLTNIFGEIPLKTEPAFNIDALNVPRSTTEQIYAQLEQDLSEAAAVLPISYSATEVGRATKGSALGLLAKVYLFQEKWNLALDAANQVGGLGYSLSAIYYHNFEVAYENNVESIFEIQQLANQVPFLGSNLNQYFSPAKDNGYFFNAPTEDFVDEFEVTAEQVVDPRLDYTVGRDGNKWIDGQVFLPEWSPATGFLGKKHVQPVTGTPIGDGDLNYTFMRYAEIVLIKAEALNELGRGAEALIPLNMIRKRARESYLYDSNLIGFGTIPANLLPDVTNSNQTFLREAIRHERRVELGLEFHRFYDLMRYGKQYAEQALQNTGFNYDQNRYFPIPQSELDTNTNI